MAKAVTIALDIASIVLDVALIILLVQRIRSK